MQAQQFLFYGERQYDHFQFFLVGREVVVPASALTCLLHLIVARAHASTGFQAAHPVTIARLRRALDRSVRKGAGKALIETGSGQEYRLAIPRNQLKKRIALDPTFFELEALKVVPKDLCQKLRKICRVLKSSRNPKVIKKKSKSN